MRINFTGDKAFGFVLMSLLSLSGLTTAAQRNQPQAPADSEWSFSVKQDQTAQSDITARNICFKRHRFHVELQNLPFMKLVGPATFQVNAGSEYKAPVKIDASGLTPGDYEGTAVVMCETCPKEKGCTQDRQNLHVRMTVTGSPPMQATTVEDQKKIDRLIQQLGADDIGERDEAQQELVKIGAPAIPSLEKALSDPDLERRTNAAAVLKRILGTVPEAEPGSAQSPVQCVLDQPFVLISQTRIASIKDLSPLLGQVAPTGKPLLILAEDVEGETIASLVVNRLPGAPNVCAVKASGFGDRGGQLLRDIATLTGGKVIGGTSGPKLETAQITDLGRAGRVVAYQDQLARIDHIFIIDSEGDPTSLENLAHQVRDAYERKDVFAGYLHLYLAAIYKLAGRPLPSGLPPLPEPEPRRRYDFVMVSRTAPITVTPQPSSERTTISMPAGDCKCTKLRVVYEKKKKNDKKEEQDIVVVKDGKISMEFKVKGSVTIAGKKDKIIPDVTVRTYLASLKGGKDWALRNRFKDKSIVIGELNCPQPNPVEFDQTILQEEIKANADEKGKTVTYELHINTFSKECKGRSLTYVKFTVTYDEDGKPTGGTLGDTFFDYEPKMGVPAYSNGSKLGWTAADEPGAKPKQ